MLALDLQQILSQALSFLLLLWVLKRFAWRPLLGVLDARRAKIEAQLQDAARRAEEMVRAQQELTQRLAAIDAEARSKIQEAVQEGRRVALEIQEDARVKVQELLAKSQDTIAMELDKAKVSLRNEMVEMTMDATERLLRETLDEKKDQKLIGSILDELERESASR